LKSSPEIPHIEVGRVLQKGTSYSRKLWVKENKAWPNRVSMREMQNLSSTEYIHKLNNVLHDQKSKHLRWNYAKHIYDRRNFISCTKIYCWLPPLILDGIFQVQNKWTTKMRK
jgi:hypothetical protein